MARFVRNKNIETPVTEHVNYSEVNDASTVAAETPAEKHAAPRSNGFHFNKAAKPAQNPVQTAPAQESTPVQKTAEAPKKHGTNKPVNPDTGELRDWDSTNKVLPKFVNKSPKSPVGTAVEFSKSALDLCKRNDSGYRESLDGKFLMNFWTFDKERNNTLTYIPTYIDTSEWLNVCHMILSGRLHEETEIAREKQAAGGYQYCNFIYQSVGGSYAEIFKINGQKFGGKNGNPIATIFKITPAVKDGNWTLSTEIYDGIRGETGLIEAKKGSKPIAKITVLFSYSDLVRVARMSEIAIQAHFNKML